MTQTSTGKNKEYSIPDQVWGALNGKIEQLNGLSNTFVHKWT
jgi:hypothetical protein